MFNDVIVQYVYKILINYTQSLGEKIRKSQESDVDFLN